MLALKVWGLRAHGKNAPLLKDAFGGKNIFLLSDEALLFALLPFVVIKIEGVDELAEGRQAFFID